MEPKKNPVYGKRDSQQEKPRPSIREKKEDFSLILSQYLESNPIVKTDGKTAELEIRFGTNKRLSNPLTKIDYDNVVKRLLSCGFTTDNMNGNQLLRINTEYIDPRTGQTKMSNIRAEIAGISLIREYCRTNSIKALIDNPSTLFNKLKFTKKANAITKQGAFINKLDMDDFNFRVSFQTEQDFSTNSGIARDIITKWMDSKKMFRCLNRVRFHHPKYPVFADVSIVKSSKTTNKIPVPQYTIQEAGVFQNVETYEIELEVDNQRIGVGTEFNTKDALMTALRSCIRIVLGGLQQTKYPISYTERDDILRAYMHLIHGATKAETEGDDTAETGNQPKTFQKVATGVTPLQLPPEETTDYTWMNRRVRTKDFIGPSSMTLQIENIQSNNGGAGEEVSNVINITKNYTVTEKADGERKLLYIDQNGKIYLIDTNMNVIFTGAKTIEKTVFNSLLDGEHIKKDKSDNDIHLYAAFDIYIINKKSVREFPFYPGVVPTVSQEEEQGKKGEGKLASSSSSPPPPPPVKQNSPKNKNNLGIECKMDSSNMKYRLPLLDCFVDLIKPTSILESSGEVQPKLAKHSTDFRVQRKTFYSDTENLTIFDGCSVILSQIKDGTFEYNTDGLIFTPSLLAVGAEKIGDKPSPLMKTTWKHSFKWKPPEFNTIDFLVSMKKDKTGKDEIHNVFQEGRNLQNVQEVIQYKTLILRCGFNERVDGYLNPYQDILNDVLPSPSDAVDDEDLYKPVPFQPTDPYDVNACYCNIRLKEDGSRLFMMTEENEYFEENMIVEFKYIVSNDDGWKWVPLRVRYDKTAELNSGQKNYGNAYRVANNNWHSIHNPVTEEMISSGKGIPEFTLSQEVYYNRSSEETSTQSMRDFHNLFVKKNLIQSVSNRGDTLIDYAVGKAGDLPKWIMAKLNFVFGIDISRDNVHNHLDGACARYLNSRKKYPKMLDALFVNGDSKLNIRDLNAFATPKDKEIANAVFGIGAKDVSVLGKGVYRQYGVAQSGFNVSSCQFALHYFFENSSTFHSFLRNIAECTKIEGYFIGTCYDGQTVFDMLRTKENGESLSIIKNERKIFEITKLYDETGFPDDELSLGYPINVYQESINQVFREYLVNFDYLKRIMEDYGFVLLSKEDAVSLNLIDGTGMFDKLFHAMEVEVSRNLNRRSDYRKAIYMSPEEKRISFMNRYFVFKKVRTVDVSKISSHIKRGSRTDDAEKPQEKPTVVLIRKKRRITDLKQPPDEAKEPDSAAAAAAASKAEPSENKDEPQEKPQEKPQPPQPPSDKKGDDKKDEPKQKTTKKTKDDGLFGCSATYEAEKDGPRFELYKKLSGQQLRDILFAYIGLQKRTLIVNNQSIALLSAKQPIEIFNIVKEYSTAGKKSSGTYAKNNEALARFIICLEKENK